MDFVDSDQGKEVFTIHCHHLFSMAIPELFVINS